jgi:hypothetical protein
MSAPRPLSSLRTTSVLCGAPFLESPEFPGPFYPLCRNGIPSLYSKAFCADQGQYLLRVGAGAGA